MFYVVPFYISCFAGRQSSLHFRSIVFSRFILVLFVMLKLFAFFLASFPSGTDNAPSLLTASTEGRVSTWNPSQLSQPLQDMRLT